MTMIKTFSAVVFASACTLAALTGASEARPTPHRMESPTITGSIPAPAQFAYWLGGPDTDSGNAKNPALPGYAQARGQETGGPARELIPN
ncbi:hypothetical protein [Methylobacterium sp. Leaf91]|uniref:hypothetical protein n=1 Tax=Methylobacterium sp. Leaf91 TaxID=1736247 RepID=UPI0006FAFEB6|nr:hypothetical protein [Methylobacterium sp. Leaf91]KQO96047.1 hypothetical protein ASF32_17895 [Methylobacterium sp. Leaf91]